MLHATTNKATFAPVVVVLFPILSFLLLCRNLIIPIIIIIIIV